MNDNDDVMSFGDEPEIKPEEYPEPPETAFTASAETGGDGNAVQKTPSEMSETISAYPDDASKYNGWEAMDEKDFKEKGGNTGNEQNKSSDDAAEEQSQAKKILDTKPSAKTEDKRNLNKGFFINRQKILLILSIIFVIGVIFFTFGYPIFTKKRNKEKKKELDKNGKSYIPSYLQQEYEYEVPYDNGTEDLSVFENGNSASSAQNYEDLESRFPSPGSVRSETEKKNVAPVQIPPSQSSTSSDVPITNRNEQQKQIQRLTLEKTYSPVEEQMKKSGSKYATVKPDGYDSYYGSSYNSPYTGTDAGNSRAYTPAALSSNLEKFLSSQGNSTDSYQTQNNQSGKKEFLNGNKDRSGNYEWNSESSLWKGSVITVVLDTGINTDLPGSVMGHVTRNVYSSENGQYLLIPMGSRVYGEYSSDVSYGQSRIQVVWNTLIRPDGLEINLGSMNGIDAYGVSGYNGFKTEHPFEYLKAFGLIAAYSILDTKALRLTETQNNAYAQNVINDVYAETKKLNNKIVDRALDIQPTIKISSGKVVNLITNVTIDLPPLDPYEVEQKYIRY